MNEPSGALGVALGARTQDQKITDSLLQPIAISKLVRLPTPEGQGPIFIICTHAFLQEDVHVLFSFGGGRGLVKVFKCGHLTH
eukprot:c30356_g1_i1 orf=128-376(+)